MDNLENEIKELFEKTTPDTVLSSKSTRPVENRVISANFGRVDRELGNRVLKEEGKGLSSNDFTDEYKNRIEPITVFESEEGTVGNISFETSISNSFFIDIMYSDSTYNTTRIYNPVGKKIALLLVEYNTSMQTILSQEYMITSDGLLALTQNGTDGNQIKIHKVIEYR